MTELPDVIVDRTTCYEVSCVPESNINYPYFAIKVEYRGNDRWAVKRRSACLSADGTWDYETSPSGREDDWLDQHRFDLPTALRLARKAAPHVKVNGHTVADALRDREEW